ncbi:MAG: hypothetical protein WD824_16375 [Cyclobacteriaceae bacterium]
MRKAIYIPVIISFLVQCCDTEPDMMDSYTAEYFCFDGYRGIGVVSVPVSSGSYNVPVFAQPIEGADQIASLVAKISSQAKTFTVEGDAIAENALFEFAYEHLGLPVESIEGDWIKLRLGDDVSGNRLSGWISNTPSLVVERWDTYLPSKATFLATCVKPMLYKAPEGEVFYPDVKYLYDNTTKTKRPDYRINYLEVDGEWLKVQFVTPSDLCGGGSQETVITEGWVPFLLDDKSPTVWFYPRGC